MNGKKSFLMYVDYLELFEELSDEDAGQLIKHIFRYVNDLDPTTDSPIVRASFIPIKLHLKRDLLKWKKTSEIRSEIGKKGGLASGKKRKQKEANEPIASNGKQKEANASKRTDSVSVSVSVSDNEKNKTHIPEFNEFLSYAKTLSIYHESMNFQIEAKYTSWKENKWKDGNNKKIGNWKTKLRNTMPYFKRDFTAGSMKSKFTYEELLQDTAKFSPDQRKSHFEKFELFEEHGKKYYRRKT